MPESANLAAMKATTKSHRAQAGRDVTVRDLIAAAGMKPVDVASKARISTATVYRAMKGLNVSRLQTWAIASALEISEQTLLVAIAASRGAA